MSQLFEQFLSSRTINARAFVFFLREWFPYGADALIFSNNGVGHCTRFCMASGESYRPIEPQILFDDSMNCAEFEGILGRVIGLGFMEIPEDVPPISTQNCTDYYVIGLLDGRQHRIRIRGSTSVDPRINELEGLLAGANLRDFYRERRSKVK